MCLHSHLCFSVTCVVFICRLQIALAGAFSRAVAPKEVVAQHVDMAARLEAIGLRDLFPEESWPQPSAVRELATTLKKAASRGEVNLFVAVDLKKCVSSCLT